jgi:hypothetical protein
MMWTPAIIAGGRSVERQGERGGMHGGTRAGLRAASDVLVAVTAVLTVTASRWPWFQATLTPPDPDGQVMAPSGAATGVYAHASLWAAVGLAAAQIALLAARYYPGGRLRVPGDGDLLVLGSGLVCLLVTADTLIIPRPWFNILSRDGWWVLPPLWEGTPYPIDGTTLFMTWSYGATVAIAAALVSLAATIASLVVTKARAPRPDAAPALLPRP